MNIKQRQYSIVERTYAEALLGAAQKQGALRQVYEESQQLLQVFTQITQSRKLLRYFESPHVPTEDKLALLDRVFKGRLHPLLFSLIRVLAERRRGTYLDETLLLFRELAEQTQGIYPAVVGTAFELNTQEKAYLQKALEAYTKLRLRIDFIVDSDLVGGVLFRCGDLLVDSTLRSELNSLKERLLSRQLLAEPA